jgi:hypothetical protein
MLHITINEKSLTNFWMEVVFFGCVDKEEGEKMEGKEGGV